jgi:heterodisulfide reductase subunit A2
MTEGDRHPTGTTAANGHRIGVYICHCGTNIAQTVDVQEVAEFAKGLPGVVTVREYKYMCSDPGQDLIKQDIESDGLTEVVVSSCSPLMHEETFRGACEDAGLNRFLFQMSNIREQCSWVHHDRAKATAKAKRLISAAVRRVGHHKSLARQEVPVRSEAMVVGAGIAGIEAALRLADSGKHVYLIEKEPSIGGHMAKFDKTFPTLDCAACILTPKMVSVGQHPNITLLTLSEVVEVSGFVGNFKVKVRERARYVTEDCTGCGECVKVCPCSHPNEFEMGMSTRKAIYRTFPQAVPNSYLIEKRGVPMCEETCPIHTRTQGYVNLIAQGDLAGALKVIRDVNPFPASLGRVCHHPCEERCQRGHHDEPLAVCALKRFVADWEIEQGMAPEPTRAEPNGRRVAVVGSGPAGLTAAYDLARKGYGVTIFEKYGKPGGLMRTGIPPFRLPRNVLDREVNLVIDHGVELRLNTPLGEAGVTFDSLRQDGYDAILLALGTTKGRDLGISGEHLAGVVNCLDYLREANLYDRVETGRCVAVVGGGNAAVDAARTALRHGAGRVMLLYRRTREEMPAIGAEIEAAKHEGIEIHFLVNPVEMHAGSSGRLARVRCQRMRLGEPDEGGRRRPIPIDGEFVEFEVDQVILAISQLPDLDFLVKDRDFDLTKWATLKADPYTCETGKPGVFAAGDAVTGPSTVVEAMASGRQAATAVDLYLRGEDLDVMRRETHRPHELPLMDHVRRPGLPRKPRARIPVNHEAGVSFDEVEMAFTLDQAVEEASRCLVCGGCSDCRICSDVCERKAIDHLMADEIHQIEAGAIVVATGSEPYDLKKLPRYGYGRYDNVLSALEFERLCHASGPTGGQIVTKKGLPPKAVAILHCIGSRDENHLEYCSRVCCMYSLKFAHLVKEHTEAEVYNFYIDVRAAGKGYEEFYKRLMREGVHFIRGKAAEVTDVPESPEEEGRLIVVAEDTLLAMNRRVPVDLVILSPGMKPRADSADVGHVFSIGCSQGGFFLEKHPKLAPVDTATEGIFLAGACQGPKDIPDSVAQGAAAAAGALALIDRGVVVLEPIRATINAERCGGCKLCIANCPYSAIDFNEEKRVSEVIRELCKGCGTCAAGCPSGAASQENFEDAQIFAEIEGALAV